MTGQTGADSTRQIHGTSTVRISDWASASIFHQGPRLCAATRGRMYGSNLYPVVQQCERALGNTGASMYGSACVWRSRRFVVASQNVVIGPARFSPDAGWRERVAVAMIAQAAERRGISRAGTTSLGHRGQIDEQTSEAPRWVRSCMTSLSSI